MNAKSQLVRSLFIAVLILAIAAALSWLAPVYISAELSHRLLGAMLGAVVVAYANTIPKMLATRARLRCTPAEDQAARRFAGWSMVLGGVGYMLAWLFAPLGMAALIGGGLLAVALLCALVRCLRPGASGTSGTSGTSSGSPT